MLRLAVRVARSQAELVLAELLELAPSGVEEIDARRRRRRVRRLRRAGRAAVAAGSARRRGRGARRRLDVGDRRRLVRALARVPPPARPPRSAHRPTAVGTAGRHSARSRDRTGTGVRHRRARDDADVPRAAVGRARRRRPARSSTSAAGRACSRSLRRGSGTRRCARSTTTRRPWRRPRRTRGSTASTSMSAGLICGRSPSPRGEVVAANLLGPLLVRARRRDRGACAAGDRERAARDRARPGRRCVRRRRVPRRRRAPRRRVGRAPARAQSALRWLGSLYAVSSARGHRGWRLRRLLRRQDA